MLRKVFLFSLLTCLLVGSLYARPVDTVAPMYDYKIYNLEATKVVGAEPGIAGNSNRDGEVNRDEADEIEPRGEVYIGDDFLIGYTWYDYQHNGSIGKMIVRDSFGSVQFTWMKGYDSLNVRPQVVYNYLHPLVNNEVQEGELLYDPGRAGTVASGDPNRTGYCMLSILPTGREDPADCDLGVVFFHATGYHGAPNAAYVSTAQSVDYRRSYGAFESSYLPSWPNVELIWPHGAVDRRNYSHVFACQYPGDDGPLWHALGYWRGQVDDEYFEVWDWPEVPIRVDTTAVISQVAAASPTSDKVALAWHHSRIGIPVDEWAEYGGLYQKNSDLRYIVSDDGEEWDWDDGVRSITNIQPIRPDLWDIDRAEAYGDTFRPYCDVDIQFDPWGNDELFASFSTCGFWEYSELDDGRPGGATAEFSMLWFWSSRLDTITLIADGWYYNRSPQGGWHSRCGGWRNNTDRPSIAFNPDPDEAGTVYVVWTNFPKIQELNEAGDGFDYLDGATDTSGLGYSNAEIMVSISTDYGETFQEAYNITETRWTEDNAPDPGECMSENWPSVAYVADDSLHIMYILDLEAGGSAQPNEGGTTNNPVIYHRVALDDLDHDRDPIELPSDGFMFHNWLDFRPWVENGVRYPGVPTTGNGVHVRADVFPGGEHALTEVLLVYRVDEGDDQSVDMENVGGDIWAGTIPGQDEGTNVCYRIVATNDDNQKGFGPSPSWWWSYVVRGEGGLTIEDVQRHDPNLGIVDFSPYNGYEVTVEGIVTTPASFNEQYDAYAIQDGEGDWSGLFVRGIEAELDTGMVIRVTGIVMEEDPDEPDKWEYATYIDLSEDGLEIVSEGGSRPAHTWVDLRNLIWEERAEQLEGVLVEIWSFEIQGIYQNALDMGYWAIINQSIEPDYTWFNTNGLTAVEIKNLGLFFSEEDGIVTYTEFEWMKGVFTENNGFYAVAPTLSADVGPLAVMEDGTPSPYNFSLDKAYPNPFNASTNVGFEISKRGWTKLALYDVSGRQVMTVAEGNMNPGHYNYVVDAASLSAGVYILRLEADTRVKSQKLVLMK